MQSSDAHRSIRPIIGPESQQPCVDETEFKEKGFTYYWEQKSFDPITHHVSCAIHFGFPDGRRIDNAFTYEFRLWTLPELRDILLGAHFRDVKIFWERDCDLENHSNFVESKSAEHEGTWMAYVVAYRS
jgi:hypothetical protein